MASSSLITSINSALKGLELLAEYFEQLDPSNVYALKKLKVKLRNLKAFVVLLRSRFNLGKENDVQSTRIPDICILEMIEVVVGRYAQEARPAEVKITDLAHMENLFQSFMSDMVDSEEKLDELVSAMSNQTPAAALSLLTTGNEVTEIADSIVENTVEFRSFGYYYFMYHGLEPFESIEVQIESLAKVMDLLGLYMTFLKNLIRFVLMASSADDHQHQLEDLLSHFGAVATDATRLFLMRSVNMFDEEWYIELRGRTSQAIRKIMPFNQDVNQPYIESLSISRSLLLTGAMDIAPTEEGMDCCDYTVIVVKEFLDSLISIFWEKLQLGPPMRDQMQTLFEALKFLRTILKQQTARNFNAKIRDQIGVLVCDAGALICRLHQLDEQVDPGFQDLSDRIKVTGAEVVGEVPQTLEFKFPKTNELGVFDYVLENLMEFTTHNTASITNSRVQIMQDGLVFLRSFLEKTTGFCNEKEELQTLRDRVLTVGFKVELLTEMLLIRDFSDEFSALTDSMIESTIEYIMTVKTDLLKMSYGNQQDIQGKKLVTLTPDRPQIIPSLSNEVVGFQDEITSIIDRLQRGSERLKIVVISGMAGSGKTTLASRVYNDPALMYHYHVRAWCPISQVLDKYHVLIELLKQIDPAKTYSSMTEQDLAEMLWRKLKGNRYIIYLDDVWTTESWNNLEGSFPDDSNFSRILLTSRIHNVAPQARLDEEPHLLRPFTDYESMELLQKKIIPEKSWPPELSELGMQIVKHCKGLPLTIVIVAGLLATMKQQRWGDILEELSLGVVSSTEQCMNMLELSYKFLPEHLKPCFLYFGAFPEDREVLVRRLIRLWIAEGFIRKSYSKRLEDVAEGYLVDLTERSLVMVAKKRSIDRGPKTCRVHDLLHEFCLRRAKEENFFHPLRGYDELSDLISHERRLCIYSNPIHLEKSKLFSPFARSMLFFSTKKRERVVDEWLDISFIIRIFKFITVLDLSQILMGSVFPCEIERLILLRYLAIRGYMTVIPSTIGNLSSLQALIVDSVKGKIWLPHTLWNLRKLKYLYLTGASFGDDGILPIENLENSPILDELEYFSAATFYSHASMEQQMSKFPNIRKLKCNLRRVLKDETSSYKIAVPDVLSRLESLHLKGNFLVHPSMEFDLPKNLIKLSLKYFRQPWSRISTIGKLPHLEVLKLGNTSFSGESWDMEEGDFPKLRYLRLGSLDLVLWTSFSDDQLPCLKKLELIDCINLEEIPYCLEVTCTLDTIVVSRCSSTLVSLIKHIEEEQMDLGNFVRLRIN